MISHLTPSEDAALRRVVVIGELPADRERLTAALAHLGVTVHEGETLDARAAIQAAGAHLFGLHLRLARAEADATNNAQRKP